ncbi:MAG: sigma-54-dependent Fis family transcriptional regulator [Sterolibacteriaceae bacterium]|uniref:Sigma-54-dependent Fis family transcriptional regulator n=1 Tax=Candidatus Methylophosphatis roskildensis TaxID=2899263 RepID=A0A9D7E0K5_9PROT|nr:sigma-54-dependent Fis family transcriptional regulator [Candidatus Methylophosphatis roskildensis]MBK7237056.1 sigma-54-dependent Fis family transcriptional regulator [Sterolibacteriaceae bacterium]MBK7665628.1 sigma-54-dependent Fis family transcriptional regulator [Sterolibacteriaceae bacterium]MBK9085870.1 sigma-54-dependent Fis family transcriptional regulator [Sterolibacteriaceae bacterium]
MNNRTDRRSRGSAPNVLIVDDEADIRELLDLTLARMGLSADLAGTVAEARALLAQKTYRLCLTDMRLPDGDGLDLVRYIGENIRDLPVAVITAFGSLENAVQVLKAGAFDYIAKPVSLEQLRALVKSVFNLQQSSSSQTASQNFALLGESQAMQQVREMIDKLAKSLAPVWITGESGSGKERAARLIHGNGPRTSQEFIAVNCGAIPENLMESEFFGYRKGSFTGAESDRDGFFQAAAGGTLFLDEVADLPLAMQVKLLRAIQEKRVRKVGGTAEEPVDVRIISATHQNLRDLVDKGRFRQDLFYRLNVIELRMPSLRECSEDIPLLAEKLAARLAQESGNAAPPRLAPDAIAALQAYPFPGNVRELENVLERALALTTGPVIHAADLQLSPNAYEHEPVSVDGSSLQDYLDNVERQAINEALQKTRMNRTAAAKLLGVTFRSLRYRMDRLGLKD